MNLPKMKGAYIESKYSTDVLIAEMQAIGLKRPSGVYQVNLATKKIGWEKE